MSMSAKASAANMKQVDEVANMENSPIQSADLENSRDIEVPPIDTERTHK